jgi:hypothetical protein
VPSRLKKKIYSALPPGLTPQDLSLWAKPGEVRSIQLAGPSLGRRAKSLIEFYLTRGYDVKISCAQTSSTPGRRRTTLPPS